MAIERDYIGLRKAREHKWPYLFVRYPEGKILGGWYVKPDYIPKEFNLCVFTLHDYELITSDMYNPLNIVTVSDWYDSVNWDILKLSNINVNNL